ncbi:MAG: YitT family protein [Armatimonadota bacterium]
MATKEKIKLLVWDYVVITFGCLLMALSLDWFLAPYKISPGGVSGLSIVLFKFWHVPLGITMLLFNIPLFLIGLKFLGKQFGAKTLYGIFMSSFLTDFITEVFYPKFLPNVPVYLLGDPSKVQILDSVTPILASIFGGILLGVGLGLVFRAGGSTGGSDIVAQICSKYKIMTAGQAYVIADFFVISLAGFAFKNVGYALVGFLSLIAFSKVIDMIVEGLGNTKAAYIISDKDEEIRGKILKDLYRGCTIFYGKGAYTENEREILMCVVSRREIYKLIEIVKDTDRNAFVILTDIYEVYGQGFTKMPKTV